MPYEAARLYVTVGAETRDAEAGLRSIGQKVDSFAANLKNGLLQGAGIAAFNTALQGLSSSFEVLKRVGIDYNALLEQTRIAFTTMLAPVVNGFRDMQAGAENAFVFMQQLKKFAADTPFEFPELVANAQRLKAMGFAIEEVIPQLESVGNVSAAFGKGKEGIDRMILALGQMSASGKVMKEDLNQLIDVGVPVFDILANATGKPKEEMAKLVESGEITSDFFIKAFNDWSKANFGDMMSQQSKTFTGALSSVADSLRDTLAGAAEPFFNRMRDGLVGLNSFLASDQFQVWAAAGKTAMEGIGQAFDGMVSSLAPIGAAIADVFGKLSQGDVGGAMDSLGKSVQAGLQAAIDTVNAFGEGMFGAGWNLITQLGSGMAGAFDDTINVVVDGLTVLAQMLIGNSPPPMGPLKDIDKGGAAAGQAWADPFGMALKEGATTAVGGVKTVIDGLKAQAKEVAGQIRDIDAASKDLERSMRAIRTQIDSVKDGFAEQTRQVKESAETVKQGYADAMAGVRDQIDSLKTKYQDQTDAVQVQIEEVKDKYEAALQAVRDEIDKVKDAFDAQTRAAQDQIENVKDHYAEAMQAVREQIDAIKDKYGDQTRAIQDQIDTVKDKYGDALDSVKERIDAIKRATDAQTAPLERQIKAERDRVSVLREQEDIQRRLQAAQTLKLKLQALGDPKLRAELGGQLASLGAQEEVLSITQQLGEARDKLADPELTAIEKQQLTLKIQQLEIQKKLAEMVDATQLGEATRQDLLQSAQEQQLRISREIEDVTRRTIEIPIEQQIKAIKDQADSALTPLTAQLALLEKQQKTALEPLQESLKAIKREEADALTPLQDRLKGLEREQKAALEPLTDRLREIKREEADALKPLQSRLKSLQVEQKAALEPLTDRLKAIKAEEKDALKPLEARIKSLQAEATQAARQFDGMLEAIQEQQRTALKPLEDQLAAYQKQKEALSEQKEILAGIKAELAEAASAAKEAAKGAGAQFALKPGEQRVGTKPLDPGVRVDAEKVKQAGRDLASKLADGFSEEWHKHIGAIIGGGIGAALGGIAFGPIGAVVGGALGAVIGEKLQAKLSELGITPDSLIEAISKLVTKVRDDLAPAFELFLTNVNNLFKTLEENKEVIAGIVAGLATFLILARITAAVVAFAAAWGPTIALIVRGISIVGSLVSVFTETGSIMVALGAAATVVGEALAGLVALLGGPVTLIILAIAAVIGVLTAAWIGNWGDIQGKTFWLADQLAEAFDTISKLFKDAVQWASDFWDGLSSAWDSIADGTRAAWDALTQFFTDWWDVLSATVIGGPVAGLVQLIASNWDKISAYAAQVWEAISNKIREVWEMIPADIRDDLVLIYNTIKERLELVLAVVIGVFVLMAKNIVDKVEEIDKYISDTWEAFADVVKGVWQGISDAATAVLDAMSKYLSDQWDAMAKAASDAWAGILRFFDQTFGESLRALKRYADDFVRSWGTWSSEMVKTATETGKNIIDGLWGGVESLKQTLITNFWDLVRAILTKVKEALGIASPSTVFYAIGEDIVNGLWNGVRMLWEGGTGFGAWFAGLFDAGVAKVLSTLGIPSPGTASSIFLGIGKSVVQSLRDGVAAIWEGASGFTTYLQNLVSELVGRFVTGFGMQAANSQEASILKNIGEAVLNSLWNGLKANVDQMLRWLREEVVDKIPEVIRKALGINSPSRVMFDLGVNTMRGLIDGMKSKMQDLGGIAGLIRKLMPNGTNPADPNAARGEIADYIRDAARKRGIDEVTALTVALSEGGVDQPAKEGAFATGHSWWPFQLHYGGKGYEQYGTEAGMGNDFTRVSGWSPGDPRAWKDSIDFALDHARTYGWDAWYGARAHGITGFDGINKQGYATGGVTKENIYGTGPSGRGYVVHSGEGIFTSEQMARLAPIGPVSAAQGQQTVIYASFLGDVYGYNDFETQLLKSNNVNRVRGRDRDMRNPGGS